MKEKTAFGQNSEPVMQEDLLELFYKSGPADVIKSFSPLFLLSLCRRSLKIKKPGKTESSNGTCSSFALFAAPDTYTVLHLGQAEGMD